MFYVIGGIALVFVVFIVWRISSVGRGARKRDERILALLDPIGLKFDRGEVITPAEVLELALCPELRFMLFVGFREMGHGNLLPEGLDSPIHQAEAALAYWMMHPNELQDAPAEMVHVKALTRSVGGAEAEFHVFRYRMADGHWAADRGWLLGLAGPVDEEAEPYTEMPGAFSRMDKVGDVTPEALVDWWVEKVGVVA